MSKVYEKITTYVDFYGADIEDIINDLRSELTEVPREYRSTAKFYEDDDGYGGRTQYIEYCREPTKEELEEQKKKAKKSRELSVQFDIESAKNLVQRHNLSAEDLGL